MNPSRWQQIKSLVQEALDRHPSDRDRWLAGACQGDVQLLGEVRTLVNAAAATLGFLQSGVSALVGEAPSQSADQRQSGRMVGHYQLLQRIGAGAMGEVYRSRDLALGRDAALKLLPSSFDSDLKIRLLREAEASAKLQHPAIATFYEAGESDGETFIAMEFVAGRSLRDWLHDGSLPADDAVAVACCLLEALAHAHAAGLLHRDIKPENIIVVGRRFAKLLDFSIARPLRGGAGIVAVDAATRLRAETGEGPLVGTIGYLAPEQIAGDSLDERTDVFQVGAVLYEMLTGQPAFPGASLLDRLSALMMGGPNFAALADARVPQRLADIVRIALSRQPAERFPSAAAFLRDLRDHGDVRAATAIPRVVGVFDFVSRGASDRVDWLGSSFAESVRSMLARVAAVRVIPRDRTLAELGRVAQECGAADPLVAGLRLGCQWAVLGDVEGTSSSITASAEVVDVATGDIIARERVAGVLKDIAVLQGELTAAVGKIVGGPTVALAARPGTTTFEAQECYTRARLLIERISKGSLEDARVLLDRAIAIDARHGDALAALATTHALRAIATTDPNDYEKALAAADQALAVDPTLVRAHVWKGYVLTLFGHVEEAAAAYGRAIELDPSDAEALYFAAGLKLMGQPSCEAAEALRLLQRAIDVEDTRGLWWLALGTAHRCLGQSREATSSFRRAQKLEHTPGRFGTAGAAAYVGEMLRRVGRLNEARTHAVSGIEAAERSDHSYRDTFRAHALTVLGRVALDQGDESAAEAAFNQVLAQARGRPRPRACGHFVVHALCGLARATRSVGRFEEARRMFETRDTYNFGTFYGALNSDTLAELALTAQALGLVEAARRLQAEAAAHGAPPTSGG